MKKLLLALFALVEVLAVRLHQRKVKSARRKRECECDLDGYYDFYEFAEYPASLLLPNQKGGSMIKTVLLKLLACSLAAAMAYLCAWSGGTIFKYAVQNVQDIGIVFLPFLVVAVFLLGVMSFVTIVVGFIFSFPGVSDNISRGDESRGNEKYQKLGRNKFSPFSLN